MLSGIFNFFSNKSPDLTNTKRSRDGDGDDGNDGGDDDGKIFKIGHDYDTIEARRNHVISGLRDAGDLNQENLKRIIENPIGDFPDPIDVIELIEVNDIYELDELLYKMENETGNVTGIYDMEDVVSKAVNFITQYSPPKRAGSAGGGNDMDEPDVFNAFWVSAHGVYLSFDDHVVNTVENEFDIFRKYNTNLSEEALKEAIDKFKYSEAFSEEIGRQNGFDDYDEKRKEREKEWVTLYKGLFNEPPDQIQIEANEKLTNPVIIQGSPIDFTIEYRWAHKFEAANGSPPSEADWYSFMNDLNLTVLVRQIRDMCGMMFAGEEWNHGAPIIYLSSRQQEKVVLTMMMIKLQEKGIIITTNIIQLYIFFTRRILRRMFEKKTSGMTARPGEDKQWIDDTREGAVESWGVNMPHMTEQATQYTFKPSSTGESKYIHADYGLHMMNETKSMTDTNLMDPDINQRYQEYLVGKMHTYPNDEGQMVWNRKIKMARIALKKLIDTETLDIVDIVIIKSVSGIDLTPIFDSACQHTEDGRGILTRSGTLHPAPKGNVAKVAEDSPYFGSQPFDDDSDDEKYGGKRRTKKVRNTRKKSTRRTTKRRATKRKKKNKPKKKTRHRKR